MSIILAIDTSTEACSCALNIEGKVFECFELIPRQHASRLLPMIDGLMNEHGLAYTDLDAVAPGRGPGSFTGLRIAAGVAQGIAFGAELPVIPVSTLAALAVQAYKESNAENIFACLDARISEVYWAIFNFSTKQADAEPTLLGPEALCKPGSVDLKALSAMESCYGVGSGMAFIKDMPEPVQEKISSISAELLPRAVDIALLASQYYAQGVRMNPAELAPVYLRDKVTHNN